MAAQRNTNGDTPPRGSALEDLARDIYTQLVIANRNQGRTNAGLADEARKAALEFFGDQAEVPPRPPTKAG